MILVAQTQLARARASTALIMQELARAQAQATAAQQQADLAYSHTHSTLFSNPYSQPPWPPLPPPAYVPAATVHAAPSSVVRQVSAPAPPPMSRISTLAKRDRIGNRVDFLRICYFIERHVRETQSRKGAATRVSVEVSTAAEIQDAARTAENSTLGSFSSSNGAVHMNGNTCA